MSISRPVASQLPTEVSVQSSAALVCAVFKSLPVRVFKEEEWNKQAKVTAKLARSHPLYAVILRGQSVVRRTTDSVVRRLEDILAWQVAIKRRHGPAAAAVIDARLRRGTVRRAHRLYGLATPPPPPSHTAAQSRQESAVRD